MTDETADIQPEETPARKGWGPVATVGLVLIVWFLMEVTGIVVGVSAVVAKLIVDGSQAARPDFNEILKDVLGVSIPVQTFFINPVLLFVVYVLARKAKAGPALEYLGLTRVSVLSWSVWLLPVVGYGFLQDLAILGLGIEDAMNFQNTMLDASPIWVVLPLVVVAAPVFEEVLIRGFMYRGLIGSKAGVTGTVLLTALVWSMMHYMYGPLGILFIFVLGVILGYARHRTGSVATTIYCHMIYNLLAFCDVGSVFDMYS